MPRYSLLLAVALSFLLTSCDEVEDLTHLCRTNITKEDILFCRERYAAGEDTPWWREGTCFYECDICYLEPMERIAACLAAK